MPSQVLKYLCLGLWMSIAPAYAEEDAPPIDAPAEEAAPEPPALPRVQLDPAQVKVRALERELKDLYFIDIGETEILEKAAALYLPANRPQARAGVLLLHDDEQSLVWPQVIDPLRQRLPDYGFATLALMLPSMEGRPIPERTLGAVELLSRLPASALEAEQPTEETPTEEDGAPAGPEETNIEGAEDALDTAGQEPLAPDDTEQASTEPQTPKKKPYVERIHAHLQAGLQELQSRGHDFKVLIAYGGQGLSLLKFLEEVPAHYPLILVDIRETQQPLAVDIVGILEQQKRPILDIYFMPDTLDEVMAKARADAYRRAGNFLARQHPLVGEPLAGSLKANERIVQRVRGWLSVLLKEYPKIAQGQLPAQPKVGTRLGSLVHLD
ncbi:Protein of unknown function [Allopseudospirillum japonicum]|uniref:DUF3530 domain-containing protein n=1 Tax=Allopseudospirillum japonicum TaxID=64971 RepID=A0A1H6TF81_9GAMM|nr:DUF3530 family protein [Allopseudospirillum japonicum]SEI75757.1 Protein of unknown function [Allopseudospirillum japonicum]